jgi:hypothetical protein
MPDRFVLHRARVQKGVDLTHIVASTALNPVMAARIDQGRFEDLPAGIYARSYVRTFARAVGMSPDEALARVQPFLRATEDPIPTLRERAPKSPFEGFRSFLATQARPSARLREAWTSPSARRIGAAMIDGLLLTSIGMAMVISAALVSGSGVQSLLRAAGAELALMLSVPVGLYFILLDGLKVGTIGKVVCGSRIGSGRGIRIRHWTSARSATGRVAGRSSRRDPGHDDRRAEHLALRGAPARR